MKYLSVSLSIFFLTTTGCNPTDLEGANGKSCSLDGTWIACGVTGSDSQRITISVNGGSLTETIESFTATTDCTGSGTVDFSFTGGVALDRPGASTRIPQGTDAVLVPSADIGCGAGNPGYTTLLFSDTCQEFMPSEGSPACTSGSASTVLSTMVFIKQ